MKYLKSISRISKNKINLILKTFSTETEVIEKSMLTDTLFNKVVANNLLNNYPLEDMSEKEYTFKYKYNGVYVDKFNFNLSKSAIKQYIYLHFIPSNKSGIRKNITIKNIAERIGISYPSAKTNFDLLKKVGLIGMQKNSNNAYDIIIVDEYKNHEKKEGGYISLSVKDLDHICSFNNVNELRVELKKYLWVDAKVKMGNMIKLNKENLFKNYPISLTKNQKETLLKCEKSNFKLNKDSLSTNNYEDTDSLRKKYSEIIKEKVSDFFTENNIVNLNKDIRFKTFGLVFPEREMIMQDIADLGIQYSWNILHKALIQFRDRVKKEVGYNDIINTGAYLRNKIELSFL